MIFIFSTLQNNKYAFGHRWWQEGAKFIAIGTLLSVALMGYWFMAQGNIAFESFSTVDRLITLFYLILLSSISMIVYGIRSIYRYQIRETREARKYVYPLTAAYTAFYLYFSGIVAWRPGVNFHTAYGITGANVIGFPASGSFGQYPFINIFMPPSWHTGIEVIPLDLLLMAVIVPLVSLNMGMIITTIRRHRRMNKASVNGMGVAMTIFTSCPTCAVSAIAFGISGIGAASWYATLSSYQYLFIGIVIPLLLALPFVNEPSLRGVCKMTSYKGDMKRPSLVGTYRRNERNERAM